MVDWALNLKANRLLLQVVLIPIVLMLAVPGRSSVCRGSRAVLVFAGLLPFGCWLAVDCSVWLVGRAGDASAVGAAPVLDADVVWGSVPCVRDDDFLELVDAG